MDWKISWLDQAESILLYKPGELATWHEIEEGVRQGQAMIQNRLYTVDIVYQLNPYMHIPAGNPLLSFQTVSQSNPANAGMIVMVAAPTMVQTFARIATSMAGGGDMLRFVDTLDEAAAVIMEARARRVAASDQGTLQHA
jgi:hypothetical protein